jgi:hypothetical protein
VELIGSIRRECLNHVLVLDERHLCRILTRYFAYYHQARTHLALDKDAPDFRPTELPAAGKIVQLPEVGACTIATSARLRSTASSVFRTGGWSALACSRSSLANPVDPCTVRHSGNSVVLSQARLAAVAADPGWC